MREFTDVYELQSFVIEDMQEIVDLAPTTITDKASDMFNHIFSDLEKEAIEFKLVDGAWTSMDKDSFFEAFQVLVSEDFKALLDDWNTRQKAARCESEIQCALLEGTLKTDYTNLHELVSCAERVGRTESMIAQTKYQIIDASSFNAYTNALKLYECIFGFERYRI